MDLGFQYIIENGLCTNLTYPYVASDQECQKDCSSVVNISKYGDLRQNDELNLQRGVEQQPVSVAIQANKRSFQMYQSGIYSDLDCGTQLDHGVLRNESEEDRISYSFNINIFSDRINKGKQE